MDLKNYGELMTEEMLMGPNSAVILEEMLRKHPLCLTDRDIVLDLGCGKGLTSLILARETGAKIYANDLWISAEENAERFAAWGIAENTFPYREDANGMHFENKQFRALVSVDAYHYFATGCDFFAEKILPFMKDGGEVLIAVPGIKNEYTGRSEELLSPWLGGEAYMFQSPHTWKSIIGSHQRIETVETWEMECFLPAWESWFATGHKYALGDKSFYESLIEPYTCFAGIYVKLK